MLNLGNNKKRATLSEFWVSDVPGTLSGQRLGRAGGSGGGENPEVQWHEVWAPRGFLWLPGLAPFPGPRPFPPCASRGRYLMC